MDFVRTGEDAQGITNDDRDSEEWQPHTWKDGKYSVIPRKKSESLAKVDRNNTLKLNNVRLTRSQHTFMLEKGP